MTDNHDPFAHWWSEELPPHIRAWLKEMLRLEIEQEDEQAAWDPANEIWDDINVYIEDDEMTEDDETNKDESEEINPETLQALRDSIQAEMTEQETQRYAHVVWLQSDLIYEIQLAMDELGECLLLEAIDLTGSDLTRGNRRARHERMARILQRVRAHIEELPAKLERELQD
ncbi:MAG: hypothetical protein OXE52_03385 [Chloroflexi bacterium]|nr:hypothetical protein [Chloroflexota bacterium]